jgi:hypothetical protein
VSAFAKQKPGMFEGPGEQLTAPARGGIGKAPMTAKDIAGHELTVFDMASDGSRFRMSFICQDGGQGSLSLPAECLRELIMTLPRMVTQMLRARHRDESLRLVYPADNVRIERASDAKTFIVTLTTPDGFEVSFGLTEQQMKAFGDAAGAEHRSTGIKPSAFNFEEGFCPREVMRAKHAEH